jgi:hypothetical protein
MQMVGVDAPSPQQATQRHNRDRTGSHTARLLTYSPEYVLTQMHMLFSSCSRFVFLDEYALPDLPSLPPLPLAGQHA